MNIGRPFGCIGMLSVLFLGLVFLGIAFSTTTTGEVKMVQPNGIMVERDYRYSETNLNNSQSNEHNANANKINAQATQIVRNTDPSFVSSFKLGAACGVLGIIVMLLAGFIALSRSGVLDS